MDAPPLKLGIRPNHRPLPECANMPMLPEGVEVFAPVIGRYRGADNEIVMIRCAFDRVLKIFYEIGSE